MAKKAFSMKKEGKSRDFFDLPSNIFFYARLIAMDFFLTMYMMINDSTERININTKSALTEKFFIR